jgi:hypothetical protein
VSLTRHGTPPRAREVLGNGKFFGARVAEKQTEAAAAAEKKSSGSLAVLSDEGFDDFGNLLLLSARQTGGGLEDLLQTAFGGLALGLWRRDTQQHVHAHAQGVPELGQDFAARRFNRPLPKRDVRLRHAEPGGQLLLRQAGGFTQISQMPAVSRALSLCGSSHAEQL